MKLLCDVNTNRWFDENGDEFGENQPSIPYGNSERVTIQLYSAVEGANSGSGAIADWTKFTEFSDGGYGAILATDNNFLHWYKAQLATPLSAGALGNSTIDITTGVNVNEIADSGNIYLYTDEDTYEAVAYSAREAITGGIRFTPASGSSLANAYSAGAQADIPDMLYAAAAMNDNESDPATGLFVFDFICDSFKLRNAMQYRSVSQLDDVLGLELMIYRSETNNTVKILKRLRCESFTITGGIADLRTNIPVPDQATEAIAALIRSIVRQEMSGIGPDNSTVRHLNVSSGATIGGTTEVEEILIGGATFEDKVASGGFVTSSGARVIASAVATSGGYVDYSGARAAASDFVTSGGYVNASGARVVAETVLLSGGYVDVSGARTAASDTLFSGGYVTSSGARLIAAEVLASAGNASGGEIVFSGGGIDSAAARAIAEEVYASNGGVSGGGAVIVSIGGIDSVAARSIASDVAASGGFIDYTGARGAAKDYVTSGGYVDGDEARQIADEQIASGGFVDASGARQIANDVALSGGFIDYTGARGAAEDVIGSGGYAKTTNVSTIASNIVSSKLNNYPTSSNARTIASAVATSGGFINASGARQIADEVIASGGFVDAEAVRQIADAVVAAASPPVKSDVEFFDWDATSAYIPILRGGVCYNFLNPVSALTIGAVESCAEDATILCHFSGGTNFMYPPSVAVIGEDAVESGFYRIGINRGQMIAASVSYTGAVGVVYDVIELSETETHSTWVCRDTIIGARSDLEHLTTGMTVYNGGAVASITVTSADANGFLGIAGGYASDVTVSSGGIIFASAGSISELTVAAKGTAFIRGGTVKGFHMVHSGSTPRLYLSNGGIIKSGDTIGTNEFWVYEGGIAENVSLGSGTFANLWAGAVVNGGTFNGSRLSITSGAVVSSLTILTPYVGQTQSNGCFSGGRMVDCTIGPGGVYTVRGGSAYGTVVSGVGARFVVSGGIASGVIVSSGASLTVSSGASALAVEIRDGAFVSSATGAEVDYV